MSANAQFLKDEANRMNFSNFKNFTQIPHQYMLPPQCECQQMKYTTPYQKKQMSMRKYMLDEADYIPEYSSMECPSNFSLENYSTAMSFPCDHEIYRRQPSKFPCQKMNFSEYRKNFEEYEGEFYEPEIQKKFKGENDKFVWGKSSSFAEEKRSPLDSNNTINFNNINSLSHFQKKIENMKKGNAVNNSSYKNHFNFNQKEMVKKDAEINYPCDSMFTASTKSPENYNFFDDSHEFDDLQDFLQPNKSRNDKGLKFLSVKVKDFVFSHKETTYKEIAEKLVSEMKKNDKKNCQNSNEEKNIKRRVYDAINVLIATDIFKKNGKVVYHDGTTCLLGHDMLNKRFITEKEDMKLKIQKKKEMIQIKKEKLQNLLLKNLAIKNLLNRNYLALNCEKSQKEISPQDLEIASAYRNKECFNFPLLFIELCDNTMTLKLNKSKTTMSILSKTPLKVLGDMDVLMKLNWHKVKRNLIEKWFPKEVIHYLPEME